MSKKKINNKLKKFLSIKEVVMLSLVLANFVFLGMEHFDKLSRSQLLAVEVLDVIIACIFLAEFFFELHFAKDRKRYWKHYGIYLLAAIPIPTESFEILRGIRALRLVKLLQMFAHLRYERNTRLFGN
ncbi:ion transporter [Candidatus Nomurabacteria bacterium]|nr:ion transporter [Candidatus Nomurabacteria bacterium]